MFNTARKTPMFDKIVKLFTKSPTEKAIALE